MEDRLVLVLWMWLGIAIALDEVPEDAGDEDAFVNLDTRLRAYGEIGVDFKSNAHPLGFDVGDTVISLIFSTWQKPRKSPCPQVRDADR